LLPCWLRILRVQGEIKLANIKRVYLKSGREKPIKQFHPWIFSGAINKVSGDPAPGETVQVLDGDGEFLAWGAYSPTSQIRVRIWSWDQNEQISADFFREKIREALNFRDLIGYRSPMRRLIHAESDRLPGIIADQYGSVLVLQLLSSGAEYWKDNLVQILAEELACTSIYERSDVQVRALEGLPLRTGTLYGSEPENLLEIQDGFLKYWIDVREGHKTGYYLDQRENRKIIGELCSGKTVLDCFCYSGGFTIQALQNGAEMVTLVDESLDALELAKKHVRGNQLDEEKIALQQGDVFKVLRKLRDQSAGYDVIILDPPKFAPTAALADRAARGYKDINLLALKLLNPGGLLATFSCSGGISREFFLRILSGAALDAEVNARIQVNMGQSADHSSNLSFPEGSYLKGFGIRVD
jgi:23S rRNA (cytosine1962-C5)-methyltransferase